MTKTIIFEDENCKIFILENFNYKKRYTNNKLM